jgi:hypothetical protein
MAAPGELLVLLGSNLQPALHLALGAEALDRVFPVRAELGRCRAPAVGGAGVYENRLLLCRLPPLLAEPGTVDRWCRLLEAGVAQRGSGAACPLDLDPFLLRDGARLARAFSRTPKVLALLARIDPGRRLGLPLWAWPASSTHA